MDFYNVKMYLIFISILNVERNNNFIMINSEYFLINIHNIL